MEEEERKRRESAVSEEEEQEETEDPEEQEEEAGKNPVDESPQESQSENNGITQLVLASLPMNEGFV